MSEANTIWVKAYNADGEPMNITFGFEDGKLIHADEIKRRVLEAGYLLTMPGAKPGEDVEVITHVILRIQHNKSDGTQTPCIGMYYENPKLVYCKKAYLNTPEDIATFERLSGLKLAQLQKFPGQFPKRDDLSASEYIFAAKTPFKIRIIDGTYTDDATGEVKPTKVFAGFYDLTGALPAPAQTSTPASGNAATGSGKPLDQNRLQAPDENTWKRWVFEATKFLYTVDDKYNDHQQRESLKKRMADTDQYGIDATMTLYEVLSRLIRYRALYDLFIDTGDYQDIFSMSFGDYYERHGALSTWQRMNEYYLAHTQPAKTKTS